MQMKQSTLERSRLAPRTTLSWGESGCEAQLLMKTSVVSDPPSCLQDLLQSAPQALQLLLGLFVPSTHANINTESGFAASCLRQEQRW